MSFESFAYWLQGYFEISGNSTLSDTQVQIIKDHLDLVFNKVTPVRIKLDQEAVFPKWSILTTGIDPRYENMLTTYSDNRPLAEVIVPHTC